MSSGLFRVLVDWRGLLCRILGIPSVPSQFPWFSDTPVSFAGEGVVHYQAQVFMECAVFQIGQAVHLTAFGAEHLDGEGWVGEGGLL